MVTEWLTFLCYFTLSFTLSTWCVFPFIGNDYCFCCEILLLVFCLRVLSLVNFLGFFWFFYALPSLYSCVYSSFPFALYVVIDNQFDFLDQIEYHDKTLPESAEYPKTPPKHTWTSSDPLICIKNKTMRNFQYQNNDMNIPNNNKHHIKYQYHIGNLLILHRNLNLINLNHPQQSKSPNVIQNQSQPDPKLFVKKKRFKN